MHLLVVGTRPEIVKMAPVVEECRRRRLDFVLVHTGQHYDLNMSRIFLTELGLGAPDHQLDVGSGSEGMQTAKAIVKLERLMLARKPKLTVVQGDTNTGLAASLAAVKLGLPVAHVEAGLRSFDLRMPEEHNRRIIDHLSALLFAPTRNSQANLVSEHVWGRIRVTGNTVIDACLRYLDTAQRRSQIMSTIRSDEYALLTLHRAETVDNDAVLHGILSAILRVRFPIVFPVHPRTRKRITALGLLRRLRSHRTIQLLDPLGYLDFLVAMKNSCFIMTDSGGIQEEATAPPIHRFVLVLREKTDRPEAVAVGFAKLVGTDPESVVESANSLANRIPRMPSHSPYGDGKAAVRIVDTLSKTKPGSVR